MTVEIKELVIRAIAEPARAQDVTTPGDPPDTGNRHAALVEACVKEVLRILKKSQER